MAKWILAGLLGVTTVSSSALADHGKFCSATGAGGYQKEIEFCCHEAAFGPGWTPGTDGCYYRELGDCPPRAVQRTSRVRHSTLAAVENVKEIEKLGLNFNTL